MKKTMLVALAAVSAMLALPAFASALPAHLSLTPEFSALGGASELSRTGGGNTTGEKTTGEGAFESTTTGTVTLTFHGVKSAVGECTQTGGPAGTVVTTKLPFHLVMLGTEEPGILITPGEGGHFATYHCGAIKLGVVVTGNGILGKITKPKCGEASNTVDLDFNGAAGVQEVQTYTGVNYSLQAKLGGGAAAASAMNAEATITFGGGASPTLICTH